MTSTDNSITPPMTATTTPPRERETVVDQNVVALRGMFPDYDDIILQTVLESAGGNQDRAIDILLSMSDPSFKSDPVPEPTLAPTLTSSQQSVLSQTDLDEQFARQLVMQEEQQQTQLWLQSQPDGARTPPGVYHSSRPSYNQYQPPQQGAGAADRPSEFQEQVTKIAESGKKTFANLFSKVKAKIQEFETGRPAGSSPPGVTPYPAYPTTSTQQYPQQTWSQPQPQPAYFDPNAASSTSPPPPKAPSPASAGTPARTPPVEGYDVDVSALPTATTSTSTTAQLQREPSPQPHLQPPTSATPSQGAPIDGGKLGLMPKRPVSLIRDTAPAPILDDDDDDDGLEYAESPFDDEHAAAHSAAAGSEGKK